MEIGEAVVRSVIVHQIGNRLRDEPLVLAGECFILNENIANVILGGYLRGIANSKNLYVLAHETDIALNDVAHHVNGFFADKLTFIELSQRLATHLYASAHHPNIVAGDLFVVLFERLKVDETYRSAIGIYKAESKQQYISARAERNIHELEVFTGINPELIDKGALIVEDSEFTYVVDRLSSRTKYWIDDFLNAKQVPNETTKSAIATGLIEKVRDNIESPASRQVFGMEMIALCTNREVVTGEEIKAVSERYVSRDVWETELERVAEKKGLSEIGSIAVSAKKFESRLKKVFSRVELGHDLALILPNDLSLEAVEFHKDGRKMCISIVVEEKNG